jgi:glycosyltransferase involved in cell wall biosynthesis
MRIVVTLPWAQRLGGAEAMLNSVLGGAVEHGHEIEPVFFEDGPWAEELRAAGFRVQVIPAGKLRQLHRFGSTVIRLAGLLRRRRPDLILNWSAKTQLYGSPAALLAGMSDRVLWWQQGIPDGFWLDRIATRLPARAIGCYSQAAATAQRTLRPVRDTFAVAAGAPVPPASDGSASLQLKLPPGVPVVGLVGRLQPWKGQDRLLRAQAILRARGLEFHQLIVGGDAYGLSAAYAASLPELVKELGLADAVTMTGQVPDAGPYIEQMDILVNASDPEPFGIVLLEAMARGVPVVAVDSGGPGVFIALGGRGARASSGRPEDLADALEPLLSSPELRSGLAAAGRESYLREFTDVALRKRFFERLEDLRPAQPPAGRA